MKHGQCMHFTGTLNVECKKGVKYAKYRPGGLPCIQFIHKSAHGGTYLRPGEIPMETKPFPNAIPKEACEFYEEPTDEQVQLERISTEEYLKKNMAVMRRIQEWRVRPKPESDRSTIFVCPNCGGGLHVSQSSYNGHVHAVCETPGCVEMME